MSIVDQSGVKATTKDPVSSVGTFNIVTPDFNPGHSSNKRSSEFRRNETLKKHPAKSSFDFNYCIIYGFRDNPA